MSEPPLVLEELLANLPGMAYRCRNEPEWPMIFVSEGAAGLTGYSPAELLEGGSVAYGDLIHPEDQQRVWDNVQRSITEHRRFEVEYRLIRRDRAERWVWERGHVLADKPERTPVVEGFITDITRLKLAESQLEQRVRELNALNQFFQKNLAERSELLDYLADVGEQMLQHTDEASHIGAQIKKKVAPLLERDQQTRELWVDGG